MSRKKITTPKTTTPPAIAAINHSEMPPDDVPGAGVGTGKYARQVIFWNMQDAFGFTYGLSQFFLSQG